MGAVIGKGGKGIKEVEQATGGPDVPRVQGFGIFGFGQVLELRGW